VKTAFGQYYKFKNKHMRIIFASLIFIALISSCKNSSGSVVEKTVKVWGNCEKCEKRIEDAGKIQGVSSVDWNAESKLLTLKADTSVVSVDEVLRSIAKAGHDNEKYFADDYAYSKLPETCQYERRSE
jgi:copper chaperone CopZ